MRYFYIYKTTCLINNKFYIGLHVTSNLNDGYLGSGTYLGNSIKKHGKENFIKEILEFLPDMDQLKAREKEIVNEELLKNPSCMNLKIGGAGGFLNKETQQLATRNSIRNFKLKLEDPISWINHSEGLKKSIQDRKLNGTYKPSKAPDWTGKTHRQETKDKIGITNSVKQKGKLNSQYDTCWIHNYKENKKIKREDLENYTSSGWTKGRKMSFRNSFVIF